MAELPVNCQIEQPNKAVLAAVAIRTRGKEDWQLAERQFIANPQM
jgi:hypothetical protein